MKQQIQLSDHFNYGRLIRFTLPSICMMIFTSIYGMVPKCKPNNFSEEVLVTWIPRWNKNMKLVSIAIYIPHHWCTTDDIGWNTDSFLGLEYCEEKDAWW